jgi:aldehyde dehydrogenase (NAD+)/betaine-aldehyde dehydrogenase
MKSIVSQRRLLIGGELVESTGDDWITSVDPATEEPIGLIPNGTAEDVDKAYQAANLAWPEWARRAPLERAEILNRFADAIIERAEEILRVEVQDTGNTIRPMRKIDVPTSVESLRYYAGLAPDLRGETIPATTQNLHIAVQSPVHVCGCPNSRSACRRQRGARQAARDLGAFGDDPG